MARDSWIRDVLKRLDKKAGPLATAYLDSLSDADRADPAQEAAWIDDLYIWARKPMPPTGCLRWVQDEGGAPRIEILHPDMPFLLASLSMALSVQGVAVQRVAHPVVRVRRDPRGRLQSLGTAGSVPESWMQFVLKDPLADPDGLADVLNGVLTKVRRVVGDWYAMRQKVFAAAGRQGDAEAKTFLEWIEGGHFTLMGYGRFSPKGKRLAPSGKGLGLLAGGAAQVFDAEALVTGAAQGGLFVVKADHKSEVHRPALMDLVGVPTGDGKLDLFAGLFTADAYAAEAASLPWARRKQKAVLDHFGFDPFSHNGRLLANILETLPRDILFEAEPDTLIRLAQGVLDLQTRSRVALFLLPDPFGRFLQALVYVPREGYDTDLRLRLQRLIEEETGGQVIGQTVLVNDSALARLHLVVKRPKGLAPVAEKALEAKLAKAARGWGEELAGCLIQSLGDKDGRRLAQRYAKAFPAAYREAMTAPDALDDIGRLESLLAGADIVAGLEERAGRKIFKLARARAMIPLSQVLPRLENLGFAVLSETPFRLTPEGGSEIWLHAFEVESQARVDSRLATGVVEAFLAVWRGVAEDDGFNRLIATAGLSWRQAALLRALARYLIQAGSPASLAYMARTLEAHGDAARDLVAYFEARLKPGHKEAAAAGLRQRLMDHCERIVNADEDRILKRFVNLIDAILRTNFFKPGPTISFKIRSGEVEGLPDPKPWAEIWVHGPRVEGIHLRGGKVARGGIRWSDRPEDFRTEILGLMKAQTVKNTVIVPVGAKGGFVVRQPPKEGGREAQLAEGIACYQLFIQALLELTDNLVKGKVAPPKDILRQDGDDPYLVVAADKGTASFSDIANAISLERGFWLGDAFASGGSKGYDHKGMGITAKGAWISVQRHFREIGIDPERDSLRAVGIGDMSGDVFGNGMLRSKSMKLVAAFDHRHIFLDPDPDGAKSFKERSRLFSLPRSSWADYDPKLISKGGGVFERSAKAIRLTPQIQALLGMKAASLAPADLIKAVLRLPVDLLWFGGIGTYVKAGAQNNAEVGDRANDSVRVDAEDLRANVIGEGANLAMTQAARVTYALAGGRVNTDAIDNSAGVDTSDHEVNIKILLDGLVAKGSLRPTARDKLLQDMTGEVAALVLRDNKLQTLSLSLSEYLGADLLDAEIRLIRHLEKQGRLNRLLAGLPDDEELALRQAKGLGLARPELAELLAHGKIWLKDEILKSDLPDAPGLKAELLGCFPPRLAKRFPEAIFRHPLKRELLATHVVNSMVNRLGPTFAVQMIERSGAAPVDTASAYLVVRDGFDLRALWDEVIEDTGLAVRAQYALLAEINRLAERVTPGLLKAHERLDVGKEIGRLRRASAALGPHLAGLQGEESRLQVIERTQSFIALGAPEKLAGKVANLILMASVFDVAAAALQSKCRPEIAARAYFEVGTRFALGIFKRAAETLSGGSHWQRLARYAVIEELHQCQRGLAVQALAAGGLPSWLAARQAKLARIDALIGEVKGSDTPELAALALVARQLRGLLEG